MSLYGHNILVKNKTNTNESTAVVPYGWRRKASKEWFIFLILKDVPKNGYCEHHSSGMNKNVFLQVIRSICKTYDINVHLHTCLFALIFHYLYHFFSNRNRTSMRQK